MCQMSRLWSAAGGGAVEAEVQVSYLDGDLQIMRVGEMLDQIFIYTRKM